MYNININIRDIVLHFKNLICEAQQKKANLFGFDQLDDETCFWLKDFSQTILPIKSRERWREYFRKKECLYTDIFLSKKE